MELTSVILVNRNNTLYRAKITSLSNIILLANAIDDFNGYISSLSSSLDVLTSTFDTLLYPKSEMKSEYVSQDNVNSLTGNGTYVLTGDAKATADNVKSKNDLTSWYQTELQSSVKSVIEGYSHAGGLLKEGASSEHKAEEWAVTPPYEDIMSKYGTMDI